MHAIALQTPQFGRYLDLLAAMYRLRRRKRTPSARWLRHDPLLGEPIQRCRWASGLLPLPHKRIGPLKIPIPQRACSRRVTPQRNRNELGETSVNKTGWKRSSQQENQQLNGYSLRSGRTVRNSHVYILGELSRVAP
jgi:hypothetical protein